MMQIPRVSLIGMAIGLLCASPARAQLEVEVLGVESQERPTTPTAASIPELVAALERFNHQDVPGTLALLAEAVEKHPELPPRRVILAGWYSQRKATGAAQTQLESAVVETPDDPEAFVLLGDLELRGSRWTAALLLYDQARGLLASFAGSAARKAGLTRRVEGGLASVAEARGAWPTAQKHLEKLLSLEPKNAKAKEKLGLALFRQGDVDGALEQLNQAKRLDDMVLTPEATLARWHEQAGDREKATERMIAALNKAPYDLKTRLSAVRWSLDIGQIDQAEQQAEAALRIDADSAEALVLRGRVAMLGRDFAAAETYLSQALRIEADRFDAGNYLALTLSEQTSATQRQRGLEIANNNAKKYASVAAAWSTLGWALYRSGRATEAGAALQKAASSGPLDADALYYLARLWVDQGRTSQARSLLEPALRGKKSFLHRAEAQSLLDEIGS